MISRQIKALLRANRALVVVIGFLLLWEFASYVFRPPEYLLPFPSQVILELFARPDIYIQNGFNTLMNTLAAFAMSTVIGIVLAIAIVHSKVLENTLYTLLVAFNSVPKVALAPLFVLWFGTGSASKIAVAFFIAIFAIVVDAVLGLRSVQPDMLDLAHVLGGNRLRVLVKIRMPNAMPSIFSGMKVAISFALVGVIVGEFVAAKQGLGYVILISQGVFNTTAVFAAIFTLSFLGTVLFFALELLEHWLLPWHVSQRSQRLLRH